MAEDSPRGVFLTDKQLVFVFMASTVVLVVVFLFGILVGRGVQTLRGMTPDGTMISSAQVVPDVEPGNTAAGLAGSQPPDGSGAEALTYSTSLKDTALPAEQLSRPASDPPPAVQEEPPPLPTADEDKPLMVQVAAIRSRTQAESIADRLKRKGYAAFVFVPGGNDELGVFRVRIGPFATRREADDVARRIEREEKYKPWITR